MTGGGAGLHTGVVAEFHLVASTRHPERSEGSRTCTRSESSCRAATTLSGRARAVPPGNRLMQSGLALRRLHAAPGTLVALLIARRQSWLPKRNRFSRPSLSGSVSCSSGRRPRTPGRSTSVLSRVPRSVSAAARLDRRLREQRGSPRTALQAGRALPRPFVLPAPLAALLRRVLLPPPPSLPSRACAGLRPVPALSPATGLLLPALPALRGRLLPRVLKRGTGTEAG